MILFLDFDGVLHPDPPNGSQLFNRAHIVEGLLREFPSVAVVISSTWRRSRSIASMRSFFSTDICHRIIGRTPIALATSGLPTELEAYPRHLQCVAWLRRHRPRSDWVAIDDRPYLFKPFCKNLYITDATTGLTDRDGERLREQLRLVGVRNP